MTTTNITKGPEQWRPETQLLVDTQNRSFGPEWFISDPAEFVSGDEINPSLNVSARIAYDVPADAQPDRIELSDSYGTATVDLAQ